MLIPACRAVTGDCLPAACGPLRPAINCCSALKEQPAMTRSLSIIAQNTEIKKSPVCRDRYATAVVNILLKQLRYLSLCPLIFG